MRSGCAARDDLIAARQLQRRLVGLGARVAEERAALERAPGQRLGELQLRLDVVEVRDVQQAAGLRGDGVREAGVAVAQHAHRDARGHVEVAAPLDVEQRAPLAARHHDRRLAVVVGEQAAARCDEIVLLRHGATLPSAGSRLSVRAAPHELGHAAHPAGPGAAPSSAPSRRCRAYSATQAEVKARLREIFDLPARRLDAAMELFDHAAVERRFSVEPIDRLGVPRTLGDMQERYREHALGLGRKVAREALARAGVAAADIDLDRHDVVHRDHDPVARRLPGRRPRAAPRRAPPADHGARLRGRRGGAGAGARLPGRLPRARARWSSPSSCPA